MNEGTTRTLSSTYEDGIQKTEAIRKWEFSQTRGTDEGVERTQK